MLAKAPLLIYALLKSTKTTKKAYIMDWNKSIAMLKAETGESSQQALIDKSGVSTASMAGIKRGSSGITTIQKLLKPYSVKLSVFIAWGEK